MVAYYNKEESQKSATSHRNIVYWKTWSEVPEEVQEKLTPEPGLVSFSLDSLSALIACLSSDAILSVNRLTTNAFTTRIEVPSDTTKCIRRGLPQTSSHNNHPGRSLK